MELDKNQFRCPRCKEVLTSKSFDDFQECCCGAYAVNGGENLIILDLTVDKSASIRFSSKIWIKTFEDMEALKQKKKDQD